MVTEDQCGTRELVQELHIKEELRFDRQRRGEKENEHSRGKDLFPSYEGIVRDTTFWSG